MRAFFALGDARTGLRLLRRRSVLFSFAYVGTTWLPDSMLREVCANADRVLIDSGAFTAWRKGKPIDLTRYAEWLATSAPMYHEALTLDVIGDAEGSLRNWERHVWMSPHARVVPVWHEGDPLEHLDEYVSKSQRVALGRIEGRRSKSATFRFYDEAFRQHPNAKFHALGNANPETIEPYPFDSFDSTSWQRDAAYSNAIGWPFNRCTRETRMQAYIEATETIAHRPEKQQQLFTRGIL